MVERCRALTQPAGDADPYSQRLVDRRGGQVPKTKGRLARSAACRSWYHWRWYAKHHTPPLWVTLAPPWQVVRLACRIKGTSVAMAALSMPLALLASSSLDEAACVDIHQDSGVKSESGWARLVRKFGVRLSSA